VDAKDRAPEGGEWGSRGPYGWGSARGPAETATRASAQVMLANLTGSGTLDLASSTGKPTAVVFWLNTCPHCQEALRGVMVPTNPTRLAKALDRALRQTD